MQAALLIHGLSGLENGTVVDAALVASLEAQLPDCEGQAAIVRPVPVPPSVTSAGGVSPLICLGACCQRLRLASDPCTHGHALSHSRMQTYNAAHQQLSGSSQLAACAGRRLLAGAAKRRLLQSNGDYGVVVSLQVRSFCFAPVWLCQSSSATQQLVRIVAQHSVVVQLLVQYQDKHALACVQPCSDAAAVWQDTANTNATMRSLQLASYTSNGSLQTSLANSGVGNTGVQLMAAVPYSNTPLQSLAPPAPDAPPGSSKSIICQLERFVLQRCSWLVRAPAELGAHAPNAAPGKSPNCAKGVHKGFFSAELQPHQQQLSGAAATHVEHADDAARHSNAAA